MTRHQPLSQPGIAGLVSVIVPAYNGERFVCQALDSIVAQDYSPIELIIVDDGSSDGTARLVTDYAQARRIYQDNQGNAAARNTGLAAARGEFLAFLDQDDVWPAGKLSHQVEALRQQPRAGFTLGLMTFFFEPGVTRPDWIPETFLAAPQPAYVPGSLLIRRTAFSQVGAFNPAYLVSSDMDWVMRARDAGVAERVTPQVVLHRRVHEANLMHNTGSWEREMALIMRAALQRKARALMGQTVP